MDGQIPVNEAPEPSRPPETQEPIGKVAAGYVGEMIRVILLSLAIILPIRYFLIQPFYVKGASMEPNFYDKEYLVIDELSYRFHDPVRGEIVVFRPPGDGRSYFIKRVIGLPGETVTVARGVVTIASADDPKGKVLDEKDYLGELYTPGETKTTLKDGEYFLMGDNRTSSLDSRSFGPVARGSVVGRVWVRGWPPEKVGTIAAPSYQAETN